MVPLLTGTAPPPSLLPAVTFSLPPSPLLVPLLWLTLTVSLLHDARRPRTSAAPTPASLLLALVALSIALVAAFHLVYLTRFSSDNSHPLTLHATARIHNPAQRVQHRHQPPTLPVTIRIPSVPVPDLERQANQSPIPEQPPSEQFPTVTNPTPSPIPSPVPPSPQPAPASPSPVPTNAENAEEREPTLQECGGGLTRMQVMLLIEFILEVIFWIMKCLATFDEDDPVLDLSYRTFVLIRVFYAVPVLILNASILWIGGGRVGECLPLYSELQIAYTHLILYAVFCIAYVVLGLYRLANYDSEKYTTTYTTDRYPYGPYPPTRTSSLAYDTRRYPRPRSRTRTPSASSSSYDRPRLRIPCGCCTINLP